MKNIQKEIFSLLEGEGFASKTTVTDEKEIEKLSQMENLPENISKYVSQEFGFNAKEVYYKSERAKASAEEMDLYIKLKQLKEISIIKKCCLFFAVVTALGLVGILIWGINISSMLSGF